MKPLKCCAWCGRVFVPRFPYCPSCWKDLEKRMEWKEFKRAPFPVYALFELHSQRLNHFILNMKGGKHSSIMRFLAFRIWKEAHTQRPRKLIFIPAPSKDGREDHATLFAKALSLAWGGSPYWNGLMRNSQSAQKTLDQYERRKISMSVRLPLPPSSSTYIFVDDVLTTGSTAQAAYQALGKPLHFFSWNLAYKARERTKSGRVRA